MGAVGGDLRGSLEEDPACEEGSGAGQGPESGEPGDQEERRDAGPGLGSRVWDGDGESGPGLRDPGMETRVWDWVVEIGAGG